MYRTSLDGPESFRWTGIVYMDTDRFDGFSLIGRYSAKKIEENVDAEIMCVKCHR